MPNPTPSTTVQRPDLGSLAWEYMLESSQRGFIGMSVLPVFDVTEQSADYPKIPIESLLKVPETKRAARSGYSRGDWEFETGTYSCQEHGWEEPVDDQEANLYQRFFDAESVSVEIAVDTILRGHELRVASMVGNTSNAGGNSAVTAAWSDPTNATPKADVKTGIQLMRGISGLAPNVGVCSLKVLENVLVTEELRNYLQYTSPHLVEGLDAQRATLARYLGLSDILVGGAIQDTANKGQSTVIGDIWDDAFFSLMRVSGGEQRLREPVFGRTFLWSTDAPNVVTTEQYREEQTRSNIYRVRQNVDEAIVFVGAHYLLTGVTA